MNNSNSLVLERFKELQREQINDKIMFKEDYQKDGVKTSEHSVGDTIKCITLISSTDIFGKSLVATAGDDNRVTIHKFRSHSYHYLMDVSNYNYSFQQLVDEKFVDANYYSPDSLRILILDNKLELFLAILEYASTEHLSSILLF